MLSDPGCSDYAKVKIIPDFFILQRFHNVWFSLWYAIYKYSTVIELLNMPFFLSRQHSMHLTINILIRYCYFVFLKKLFPI